jgi:hypothetical protein
VLRVIEDNMLETTSPSVAPTLEQAPTTPAAPVPPSSGLRPSSAVAGARLSLDAAHRLWLTLADNAVRVKPVRCFPWSSPLELVSLRDEQDEEQLLVADLSELDAASGEALKSALLGVGFVLDVQSIDSIEEDYEVRVWHTQTRQGKRTFQTKLDEWPWASPDGGHLVRDLSGDLFRLPPLETLDKKTREWLWAYVG